MLSLSIKSPCLAILGLSLVFSAIPIPVEAEAAPGGAKRAVAHHVDMLEGDGSCDEPEERAILAGYLNDPRSEFVADSDDKEDDEDQGDQLGSAPLAIDSDLIQQHDPPGDEGAVFFDVVVRGKKMLLAVFSRAGPAGDAVVAEEEPLKASLLLQRFRAVAPGRRLEVESGRAPVELNEPTACDRPSSRPSPGSIAPGATGEASPPAGAADRPWNSPQTEAAPPLPSPR